MPFDMSQFPMMAQLAMMALQDPQGLAAKAAAAGIQVPAQAMAQPAGQTGAALTGQDPMSIFSGGGSAATVAGGAQAITGTPPLPVPKPPMQGPTMPGPMATPPLPVPKPSMGGGRAGGVGHPQAGGGFNAASAANPTPPAAAPEKNNLAAALGALQPPQQPAIPGPLMAPAIAPPGGSGQIDPRITEMIAQLLMPSGAGAAPIPTLGAIVGGSQRRFA